MGTNKILKYDIIDFETREKIESSQIPLNISEKKANYLIHRAFQHQNKLKRQYSATTKTRSEVRGGGKKPWKQKGTGNARAGSNRSPLWKGGGVIFGPKPKKLNKKLNRKEFQLALQTLLYNQRNKMSVFNKIDIENFKTKDSINKLLKTKNIKNIKFLIILSKPNKMLQLAIKNVPNIELMLVSSLNIRSLLKCEKIMTEQEALKMISKIYTR
tara:strand:- start:260 stop:901 length:642 start_codon:yes stop_codon:yes gene_type:complete